MLCRKRGTACVTRAAAVQLAISPGRLRAATGAGVARWQRRSDLERQRSIRRRAGSHCQSRIGGGRHDVDRCPPGSGRGSRSAAAAVTRHCRPTRCAGNAVGRAGPHMAASPGRRRRPATDLAGTVPTARRSARSADGLAVRTTVRRRADPAKRVDRRVGISERSLRRRCQDAFGYGSKTLERVLRLQRLLRIVRRHRNLTDAALHAGYGDAPHLVRDARQLTGLSPRALVQQHAR